MAPMTRSQLRLQRLEASGEGHALTAARSSGIPKARSGSKKKTQGKGTKPQPSEVDQGKLEPSSRTGEVPYRLADDLWIPYRGTPTVAILQLSRVFADDDMNARMLCFEIAHRVEELGLLKGYSSVAIAGAVVHFAASSLGKDSLLSDEAVLGMNIPVRSVPDAYNALWLEQRHFRRIVRDHGGWVSRVSEPMDKRGRPAHNLMHDYYAREMPSVGSQSEAGTSSTPDKRSRRIGLREELKAEELAGDDGDEMEDWEIEEMADRLFPSLEKY